MDFDDEGGRKSEAPQRTKLTSAKELSATVTVMAKLSLFRGSDEIELRVHVEHQERQPP
jgi:hypothetical protein